MDSERFRALLSHQGPLVHVDHSHRAPAPTGDDCMWWDVPCLLSQAEEKRKAQESAELEKRKAQERAELDELLKTWTFRHFYVLFLRIVKPVITFGRFDVEYYQDVTINWIRIYVDGTLWRECSDTDKKVFERTSILESANLKTEKDKQLMGEIIRYFKANESALIKEAKETRARAPVYGIRR